MAIITRPARTNVMNLHLILGFVSACIALPGFTQNASTAKPTRVDLRKIGHLAPKGRAQDREYNPDNVVVDSLLKKGTAAIPELIAQLDDTTVVPGNVHDYWGILTVGDVAFILLSDFSSAMDGREMIPGSSMHEMLNHPSVNTPTMDAYRKYISRNGRVAIKRKWLRIWGRFRDQITWDADQKCFVLSQSGKRVKNKP